MTRFKTVAVMGTGTMGPGMGAVLARAGMAVGGDRWGAIVEARTVSI